jgi:hypothetical protein
MNLNGCIQFPDLNTLLAHRSDLLSKCLGARVVRKVMKGR